MSEDMNDLMWEDPSMWREYAHRTLGASAASPNEKRLARFLISALDEVVSIKSQVFGKDS